MCNVCIRGRNSPFKTIGCCLGLFEENSLESVRESIHLSSIKYIPIKAAFNKLNVHFPSLKPEQFKTIKTTS